MSSVKTEPSGFDGFGLNSSVLNSIARMNYEIPTPIQAKTIGPMLEGHDLIGQAQTGTGKTAAYALPLITKLDADQSTPQIVVLTPTRELAIQVAESFENFGEDLPRFRVLAVYGGQDIRVQLSKLKRGVQVIVGTPGRIMDHIRRGTLNLEEIHSLVLDEADEMLRMGFREDVEWILGHTPDHRQMALFSATMPKEVRKIAVEFMRDPVMVKHESKTATADTVRHRYMMVRSHQKTEVLVRLLEAEEMDGVLVFVKTKSATVDVAEELISRGYNVAPLNGDIPQATRERTVEQFRKGLVDVLIATDVAARGLDVERISHVINYDIPREAESYVHRIGRTGRAGRTGETILFTTNRDIRMLRIIEGATRQRIEKTEIPSIEMVQQRQMEKLKSRIRETLSTQDIDTARRILQLFVKEHQVHPMDVAAALMLMVQGGSAKEQEDVLRPPQELKPNHRKGAKSRKTERTSRDVESIPVECYRIEIGRSDGVTPGNIVGAIANETGLEGKYIGRIAIEDDFSTVDLPIGMPAGHLNQLRKAWIAGKQLKIHKFSPDSGKKNRKGKRNGRAKRKTVHAA